VSNPKNYAFVTSKKVQCSSFLSCKVKVATLTSKHVHVKLEMGYNFWAILLIDICFFCVSIKDMFALFPFLLILF